MSSEAVSRSQRRSKAHNGFMENPANAGFSATIDPFQSTVCTGRVLRSGVGHYDYIVDTPYNQELSCVSATLTGTGMDAGTKTAHLYPEGTQVVVLTSMRKSGPGIILGAVPKACLPDEKSGGVPPSTYEGNAQVTTEPAWYTQYKSEDIHRQPTNAARPVDIFPGDLELVNEMGVGVSLRKLVATLGAGQGARVQTFLLDNLVRVISDQFQHYNCGGVDQIWTTDGRCTRIHEFTSNQCEAEGAYTEGTPVFNLSKSNEHNDNLSETEARDDGIIGIPRFVMHEGDLANGFQFFVTSPQGSGGIRTSGGDPEDAGLFHAHVSKSGQFLLRSASDIMIQRTDRIQIPVRKFEVWDPASGHFKEGEGVKPYIYQEEDPLPRILELRNASKWWLRSCYRNYYLNKHEGAISLPEESELRPLEDDYDKVTESEEKFSEVADKTCSIALTKEGSIVLREAGGAELILSDGKIILSAPKGVELRSGESIVSLAHHDIIQKARNSVDISATEKDVRIKAERNLHTYAERSILLECAADGAGAPGDPDETEEEGEDFSGRGIMIAAPESRVVARASTVQMSAIDRMIITAVEQDTSSAGELIMAANSITQDAVHVIRHRVQHDTGVVLHGTQIKMHAPNFAILAGDSFAVFRGLDALRTRWTNLGDTESRYSREVENLRITAAQNENIGRFEESGAYRDNWLHMFDTEHLEWWRFTFRTSEQLGVDGEDDDEFAVYQSHWAYIDPAEEWEENEVHDTYPWPGKDKYEAGDVYIKLEDEPNIDDKDKGIAKAFEEVTPGGVTLKRVGMDNYVG